MDSLISKPESPKNLILIFFASVTVGDVITTTFAILYSDDTLEQAMTYFKENLFHPAPVVNKQTKKLEGIITTFDLLNYAYGDET
ncbi:MAG: CBS domain-containing protein [Paraglaciecola sp.]|jgi:CBS domain-containing protein